jgi:signal transduction histidine kinase/HAMP domain-containing protein
MMPRWRLFGKYATLIIALVGGALLASGMVSLYFSYRENREHLVALQHEKALAVATRIEQYIRDIEHQLGWTALPQVRADSNVVGEHRRYEYLKLLRQVPAITEVTWLDSSGREQLRVSRLAMDTVGAGSDFSKEAKYLQAKDGKTWYSPVYFRKETEPYMTISRPAGGRADGITVAEVNLKFVWEVVSRIRIGKDGLAYVVNSAGTLIAHPDISLVLQKTDLSRLAHVAAALVLEGEGESIARNLKKEEVLTAHARIPTLGWTVFVEYPLAEAFAPLYASILRTALLLLAGLVLSVMVSVYLARRMVTPIRALQQGAERVGAGQLNQRIDVHTGDELEALGEQFNKMAGDLKESYAGLERKVEERTRELTESLNQQTTTAEILRVISGTPTDVMPVLEAVAHRAALLCEAPDARLFLVEGDQLRCVAGFGELKGAIQMLSLTRDSVVGRAIIDRSVVHIEDLAAALQEFPAARRAQQTHGKRTTLAVPMLRGNEAFGGIIMHRIQVRPFSAKQIDLVKTFADQATIAIGNVRLFNEIRDKSRQLEVANKHKSEFLTNMSHELRTPLNAIIGFSEVLGERYFGELNDKQAEYVSDIHSSGKHLLSLINDILDLAKIEAGRMELELSEFDLAAALQNALTLVKERAQRHGIKLGLVADPALGGFYGDERKFKQIMLNLLSNAVKFTPEGGVVSVAARKFDSVIEFLVTDSGVGISAEDQELIFEEFKQVGRDYTSKAEGSGLGLALTKRFVELHRGTIQVKSAPGKGSTFTVTLPILHGQ